MKRILSACLIETSKFENETDLENYISSRIKKNTKIEILNKRIEEDGSLTVETKAQYLNYSTGCYFNN